MHISRIAPCAGFYSVCNASHGTSKYSYTISSLILDCFHIHKICLVYVIIRFCHSQTKWPGPIRSGLGRVASTVALLALPAWLVGLEIHVGPSSDPHKPE